MTYVESDTTTIGPRLAADAERPQRLEHGRSSIRWLVVWARRPSRADRRRARPPTPIRPGPGFPEQAPSV